MREKQGRTPLAIEVFSAALLIGIGVGLRMACLDLPNFSPVAGLALMAGAVLRRPLLAAVVPLGVMLISDQWLTGYDLPVMLSVYACFLLPVFVGRLGGRWVTSRQTGTLRRSLTLGVGGGLASSTCFFLVTNATYWGCFEMGCKSLLTCYVDAIPFFKYTVAGDVLFSVVGMSLVAIAWAATGQAAREVRFLRTRLT